MNETPAPIRVASSDSIADGGGEVFSLEGKMVAVLRRGNHLIAIEERCPHRAGPLSEGKWEKGQIVCPWHGSIFAETDGEILAGPAKRCLTIHQVQDQGGQLLVTLNPAART